jgi:ABC-type multidrug transport system ATPase subunit
MYHEADIYIFDDVLSALDAHVGKHVFDECVGELRELGRTVLMATNQLHVLPRADLVVFVKHEDMSAQSKGWLGNIGTFDELMHNADFAQLMEEVGISEDDFARTPRASSSQKSADGSVDTAEMAEAKAPPLDKKAGTDLTELEEREHGAVSWGVYQGYIVMARMKFAFIGTVFLVVRHAE